MKVSVIAALASCILLTTGLAGWADASIRKTTNIPAESLSDALRTLAKDRQFEILYRAEVVRDVRTEGAIGEFTPEEALQAVLSGTGLSYRYLDANTVTVFSKSSSQVSSSGQSNPTSNVSSEPSTQEVGKKSSQDFRVAQVVQTSAGPQAVTNGRQSGASSSNGNPSLEEVVVTAQKRDERLQDVPISVTAIAGETLVDNNQLRLQDYFSQIPGLILTPNTQSGQLLALRGITTGSGNPTVGITVDDVPFGSSTFLGGGQVVPDFDPGDLERVEVLRGPQGTLYGASSMGGLLKFVTTDPSTDRFSGRIQADTVSVFNGENLGYGVHGSVNMPISNTLAIRASGFARQDPGYVDNPVLHIDGINKSNDYGGHLSALWRPSNALSLKLSALYQDIGGNGLNDVDIQPGLRDLQQNYLPGVGEYSRKSQAYSATLNAKLGAAEVTSVTGYNINSFSTSLDASSIYGPLFGLPGVPIYYDNSTKKFSQELRLSLPIGSKVDWLIGAFYTYENSPYSESIYSQIPGTDTFAGLLAQDGFPSTYTETAAFTDLTYRFTEQFNVQVGGRESHIRQTVVETGEGGAVVIPTTHGDADAFTYLVTPQYKITPDFMVYARLASGYRAGGINFEPTTPGPGVPLTYSPDKTEDYEIGAKSTFLDNRISLDAAVYYIDWKNIQLTFRTPQELAYTGNGGTAKSQGLELSAETRPVTGLKIGGWIAFNDATLTENFPPAVVSAGAFGQSGDRLPLNSKVSSAMTLDEEFAIASRAIGFVGASTSYVGDRLGRYAAETAQRQNLPGYAQTDLRAGVRFDDSWSVRLFVNNVADKRGVLNGGTNYVPFFAYVYIPPRTIGLSAVKSF